MSGKTQVALLNLRAFAIGVGTAATLVAGYTYAEGLMAGCAVRQCMVPLDAAVRIAVMLSLTYAIVISACVAPIWLFLTRLELASWWMAVVLGFFATLGFWVFTNASGPFSIRSVLLDGLPYASCGAVAGLATWIGSGRTSRNGGWC